MSRRQLELDLTKPPWRAAAAVTARLAEAGYAAVFVGGCLRDHLCGRPVRDVDIATSAAPDVVVELFPRCVEVGRQFGVIVVIDDEGLQIEVASFRSDRAYIDGRRPQGVDPASEHEDVMRRDFTINALIYDPQRHEVRDHVGGLEDLERRRLRVVGDATARLREDRLRVLRGLRFAAQLGLHIEDTCWRAIREEPLGGLSRERIWQEWEKGLQPTGRRAWWDLVVAAGKRDDLCPLTGFGGAGVGPALERLAQSAAMVVALCLCFDRVDAHDLDTWTKREPLSRARRETILWLQRRRDIDAFHCASVADQRRLLRDDRFAHLLVLWRAEERDGVEAVAERHRREANRDHQAVVHARDLIAHGVAPGPKIGRLLRAIDDAQLAGRVGTRDQALALLARLRYED